MPSVQIGNNTTMEKSAQFGMEAKWLKEQLEKSGKTQADLARHLGLQPPVVNKMVNGKRRILASEADLIRAYLVNGADLSPQQVITSTVRRVDAVTSSSQRVDMERSVPVYGNVSAGPGGLQMGNGQALEYVRRPPRYDLRKGRPKDIFAVRVEDTSMIPAFKPGALVYVDPMRAPDIGDDVVVEVQDGPHGDRKALIKRLARRSASKITLEQHNPPGRIDFPAAKVLTLYRVMTLDDLLG